MKDMPYFMNKREWFEFDFLKRIFVLTDKAPLNAKKSYKEFYSEVDK